MPSSSLQILSAQHELSLTLNSRYGLDEILEKFAQTVSQRYLLRNVHYYFLNFSTALLEKNCIELDGHTIKSLSMMNVPVDFHRAMITRYLNNYQKIKKQSDISFKLAHPNNDNACLIIQIPGHGFIVFESIKEVPHQQVSSLIPLVNILADKSTACIEKQALKESVAQLETSHELIYKQFYYDELTNIPNRKLLLKEISSQSNLAQNSSAFILFHIKHLDRLNTKYGHEIIDKFLIKACDVFKKHLSSRGNIYRVSGDEFLISINKKINNHNVTIDHQKLSEKFSEVTKEINALKIYGLTLNVDIVTVARLLNYHG